MFKDSTIVKGKRVSFWEIVKLSMYGNNRMSSKRVIMYLFTSIALFMIMVEAAFTIMLIYKWSNGLDTCDFELVFDSVIYGYVFGIIAALAGINGFSRQAVEKVKVKEKARSKRLKSNLKTDSGKDIPNDEVV